MGDLANDKVDALARATFGRLGFDREVSAMASVAERVQNETKGLRAVERAQLWAYLTMPGFAAFAERTESVDTALYLKKLYEVLLEDYFGTCTFAKPTGDGLMLIFEFTEADLQEIVQTVGHSAPRRLRTTTGCKCQLHRWGSICSMPRCAQTGRWSTSMTEVPTPLDTTRKWFTTI